MNIEISKLQNIIKNLTEENQKIKNMQKNIINFSNSENDLYKKFNTITINKYLDQKLIQNSLKRDIIDYHTYMKNRTNEFEEINKKIIYELQKYINQINPNYKVLLYGSRATNLCLLWSDMDVVICNKNNSQNKNYDFLQKLTDNLNDKSSFIESIKYLNRAKVPVIKIITTKKYQNTMIDITMQTEQHFGIKCVNLVKEYLNKYEALEYLIFPLKTMLKMAELNDPYNGGLSSYALILMIVYFLKFEKNNGKNINIDNIGNLFYDFLFFYGGRKNTNYLDMNMEISQKQKITNYNNEQFFIIDPLNNENNVAKASYKYIEVKLIFLIALHILNEPCFCQCHYIKNDDEEKNTDINIQHNYLNKIFFGLKRGKIYSYIPNNDVGNN